MFSLFVIYYHSFIIQLMAPGIPKFNSAEKIKTPTQDIEVFKNSIDETMDRIYGRSFEETP